MLNCVSCFVYFSANKTNSKTIDAWTCPSTYSPVGTSVRSTGELKTGDGRPPGNLDAGTDISNEQFPGEPESIFEKKDSTEGAVPIYMILVILACLLVTMVITGSVSYYKAVHSWRMDEPTLARWTWMTNGWANVEIYCIGP